MLTWAVFAAALLYVGLGVASFLRGSREGLSPSRWLGLDLVLLGASGLVSAVGQWRGVTESSTYLLLLLLPLALHPLVLFGFVASLRPVPRRAWVAVSVASVGFLSAAVVWDVTGVAIGSAVGVLGLLMVVVWLLVHLITASALLRATRAVRSTIARGRGRMMALGSAGLGLVLLVPALVPGTDEVSLAAALLLGYGSGFLLWLGHTPLRTIRHVWQRRDLEMLATAELEIFRAADPETIATEYLPAIARVFDADAAWVLARGEIAAVSGISATEADELTHGVTTRDEQVVRQHVADGTWLMGAPTGSGWLFVRTSGEPMLFGSADGDVLESLARRLQMLLDWAEVELRSREADRRLREARHLEEMTSLKDDVLSTLSHELRTPLVTVLGVSEMLTSKWAEVGEEQRLDFVRRIRQNAEQLERLVTDTVDLASIRAGGFGVEVKDVSARSIVEEAINGSRADAKFRVDLDAIDGVRLTTDRSLAARVARELVENALKFSEPDTRVGVTVSATDGHVSIAVSDEGQGLPPGEVERVFDPFFRSGHVLTRTTRGLGVGLTFAAEAARRLGGHIEVSSKPGEGSTFTLRLPRRPRLRDDADGLILEL